MKNGPHKLPHTAISTFYNFLPLHSIHLAIQGRVLGPLNSQQFEGWRAPNILRQSMTRLGMG
jgi:hypothetical protein